MRAVALRMAALADEESASAVKPREGKLRTVDVDATLDWKIARA